MIYVIMDVEGGIGQKMRINRGKGKNQIPIPPGIGSSTLNRSLLILSSMSWSFQRKILHTEAIERKHKLWTGLWYGFWTVVVYVAICAATGPGGDNVKVDNGHQRKLPATFGQPYLAEHFPQDSKKAIKAPSFIDKGDFYRVAGKKKELYRSTEKIVLRFKKTVERETRSEIVARGEFWEPLEKSKQVSNRDLYVLNVKEAVTPEQLQQMMDRLKAEASVELVCPVYIDKETGKELLVGDELIVKLKDEVSEEELWQMNSQQNVSLVRRLRGTSNQYILRVNDPKRHSVLEIAETYYGTGIVEWAEPNFIFELDLVSAATGADCKIKLWNENRSY